ncbi:MAG: sensor histidine kinase [Anaerolineae bacterium]|nr:sensor histidine kinase [Anaerolineae bacterium]
MREIALHLLDIAENSVAAGATHIEILVDEDFKNDRLKIVIRDNGNGMDQEMLAHVTNPFVTSRTTRKVGLGLPLFKAAAEACNGYFTIESTIGQGTRVEAEFQYSHIDRMPLGDLAGTMLHLVIGQPEVHWLFHYQAYNKAFTFDDGPIKEELKGVSLTEPAILAFLREMLEEGVEQVQRVSFVL